MNTLEKAELTASVRRIERFSKSGIPIRNFKVLGTAGRKSRRRRKQAIAFVQTRKIIQFVLGNRYRICCSSAFTDKIKKSLNIFFYCCFYE